MLEILPIDLNSPFLSFYFKLKAGNKKLAFDETKKLPTLEQELVVRVALVNFTLFLASETVQVGGFVQNFPISLCKELQVVAGGSHEGR